MKFEDSYFEDEVRDGFYVSSLMKRSWAAQFELLQKVDELCRKHNIRYFAEWGTLLGAVRHGGMIPWDDDIDICMLKEDYNRFYEVADELAAGCILTDYHRDETTDNMVVKVNNYHIAIVPEETLKNYHGFPYVAGIDIFILDSLPDDPERRRAFRDLSLTVAGVIGLVDKQSEDSDEASKEKVEICLQKLESSFEIPIDRTKKIRTQLYTLLNQTIPALLDGEQTREVTNLPTWSNNENYTLPRTCFSDVVKLPFENGEIAVPVGYDELLQRKYGSEYMKPVRAGSSHEYPYYDKLHKHLSRLTQLEYYEFEYSEKAYQEVLAERAVEKEKQGESLAERVRGFVPLFREAHENVTALLQERETEAVLGLLADCQDAAIQIGTMIEKEQGEGNPVVNVLEQYCELLFEAHGILMDPEQVGSEEAKGVVCGKLTEFETEFAACIEKNLKKKEIVFVPYKASYWNCFDHMWREAEADENAAVYVIPAPYYYKDELGRVKTEEPHYETEGYPEGVTITSYENYNFQVHRPDTIVIQCPYDECNFAMSIHPFFYAVNLKKYTENLVYIPPLVMDEIMPQDDRAKRMLMDFCNMPGVVYADRVIVQSEQMKQVYVELLTQFAGEETRDRWESRISAASTENSQMAGESEPHKKAAYGVPPEWEKIMKKSDGTRKKVVLYSTSASTLFSCGLKMLEKMENTLRYFRESQEETALIWRPDPKAREILRKNRPDLWWRYREMVSEYREQGWGIYDDTPEAECAIALCDSCYGDGGVVLNSCRAQKKEIKRQVLS